MNQTAFYIGSSLMLIGGAMAMRTLYVWLKSMLSKNWDKKLRPNPCVIIPLSAKSSSTNTISIIATSFSCSIVLVDSNEVTDFTTSKLQALVNFWKSKSFSFLPIVYAILSSIILLFVTAYSIYTLNWSFFLAVYFLFIILPNNYANASMQGSFRLKAFTINVFGGLFAHLLYGLSAILALFSVVFGGSKKPVSAGV